MLVSEWLFVSKQIGRQNELAGPKFIGVGSAARLLVYLQSASQNNKTKIKTTTRVSGCKVKCCIKAKTFLFRKLYVFAAAAAAAAAVAMNPAQRSAKHLIRFELRTGDSKLGTATATEGSAKINTGETLVYQSLTFRC